MLIDPEDGVKLFASNIGDVVGVPDGHINKAGLATIEFEGHDFVGANAAKFDGGFAFDHCKTLGFPGMEMVTAGDAGDGGAEADLASAVEFYGFYETAPVVGVEFEVVREETFVVEVTEEGVPEVTIEGGVEVGYFALFEVVGFVCF